jgi:hypothetical protein
VLVIDDTMIANRGYLPPLLSALQDHPRSLIYPHTDSLLAWGIYWQKKDNPKYMEKVVSQESTLGSVSNPVYIKSFVYIVCVAFLVCT